MSGPPTSQTEGVLPYVLPNVKHNDKMIQKGGMWHTAEVDGMPQVCVSLLKVVMATCKGVLNAATNMSTWHARFRRRRLCCCNFVTLVILYHLHTRAAHFGVPACSLSAVHNKQS